jgi:hypothetical protein
MRRGKRSRSDGVMEKWSNGNSNNPVFHYSKTPSRAGFALYEVLIGVAIFAFGVIALGRAAQNCLNASTLSAEEDRVRQILSNRMAEIQATLASPDAVKEFKVDTGYGVVKLIQKSTPSDLTEPDGSKLGGINRVTLTVQWERNGAAQSRQIEFYVYRSG